MVLFAASAYGTNFVTTQVISDGNPSTDDRGRANTNINSVPIKLNALTTVGDYQFVSYYQGDGKLVVGRRPTEAPTWSLFRTQFTSFNINDDHNISSIGIDGDGILHMSWGMHGHNLLYTKSTAKVLNGNPISLVGGNLGNASAINTMTGLYNTGVTYPAFYNLPDGDLLFPYRNGGSGDGDYRLRRYEIVTDQWSELGAGANQIWLGRKDPASSLPDVNGYPNQLAFDSQGNIHATWTWRTGGDTTTGESGFQTNHHINYARSTDGGATWTTMNGTAYTSPIYETNAEIAIQLPEGSSLINTTGMAVDMFDQPVVASWWAPGAAMSDHRRQYMLAWYDNSQQTWRTSQITNRTIDSPAKTGGAVVRDLGRPIVVVDDDNRVIVGLRHNEGSNGLTIAYSENPDRDDWKFVELATEDLGNWEPTYDINRWNEDRVLSFLYQPTGLGQTSAPISVLEWDSQAFFEDLVAPKLTLVANRDNGTMSIRNSSGETVAIDGYSIHSPSGSLDASGWLSLQDQNIGQWQEANPTATRLNELNPDGSLAFNGSTHIRLGNAFAPSAATLPEALTQEDVAFEYTTEGGEIRNGIVEYAGYGNLVLFVNPLTGAAVLRNHSRFDVGFEAYTVVSESGSLLYEDGNWSSLADQSAAGGDWQEASVSAGRLSELKFSDAFLFGSGEQFELGRLFDAQNGDRDLSLEFLLQEGDEPILGLVVYQIPGDYNGIGAVDAADYVVWRTQFGQTGLGFAADGTGLNGISDGIVDHLDYGLWRSNFGTHSIVGEGAFEAASVPEPNCLWGFAFAVITIFLDRRWSHKIS